MKSFFRFEYRYFLLALLLFVIEAFIAVYVKDKFFRPIFGDFLVVILLYAWFRAFTRLPINTTAIAVLIIAYLVEIGQYFHLIELLGLRDQRWAVLVLGTSFQVFDLVAYTLGVLTIWGIETWRARAEAVNA